jgi:hypothetical protein
MTGTPQEPRSGSGSGGGSRALVAGVAGLVLVVAIATAGVAFAGDQPTVIYSPEESYAAAPGETVAIDVRVSSDGGVGDVGVEEVQLVAAYDETNLTAVDVEAGTWLEGGEPTDVRTETAIDGNGGEVTVDQWRDPPAGGVTGDELFATITFEVPEDARPGNTTITFGDSEVRLTDQYPLPVFGEETTVSIQAGDGGGDRGLATPVVVGGLAAVGALLVIGAIGVRRL